VCSPTFLNQGAIHISETRINDRIRVPEVRLVGPNGEQVGVVRIEDALRLAAESDLDLVEVAPQAKPPVCKLMDFGKFKYEAAMKAREARKNQTNTVLKEVRFRLKIDSHDYETKTGHAKRFLSAGDKVKAMIQFRGREQQRPEMGIRLLEKFAADVAEFGVVESAPRIDGRNMVMVIGPLKNKAEAKAEARRSAGPSEPTAPTRRQQRAAKMERIDTQQSVRSGQSVADAMPEGLRKMAESAAAAEAEAPQTEVPAAAPAQAEAPKTEAPKTEATKAEDSKSPAPKAAPRTPAAPRQTSAPRTTSAPRSAAPRTSAAPKTSERPAPKAAAPKAAPKPAVSTTESAQPAAAPKPTQAPKPAAAPKPSAMPKPGAAPKPQGRPKPGAGRPTAS
jgi:translation initiation factor IF-3